VRGCVAAARRAIGVKLADSREFLRSGGEDGLYRVHLEGGAIVEVTIIRRSRVQVAEVLP